jgi:hypothetical protein
MKESGGYHHLIDLKVGNFLHDKIEISQSLREIFSDKHLEE